MFRTKLRKTDVAFSSYIRSRDDWRCLACGIKSKDYSRNRQGLHCSHFWGRGRENVRFDPDNCVALCTYHHRLWGHGDGHKEYEEFMINRLGWKVFDDLTLRAHFTKKRDDVTDMIIINAMMEELKCP